MDWQLIWEFLLTGKDFASEIEVVVCLFLPFAFVLIIGVLHRAWVARACYIEHGVWHKSERKVWRQLPLNTYDFDGINYWLWAAIATFAISFAIVIIVAIPLIGVIAAIIAIIGAAIAYDIKKKRNKQEFYDKLSGG